MTAHSKSRSTNDLRGVDPQRRYSFAEMEKYEGECRSCGIVLCAINVAHPCPTCGRDIKITRTYRRSRTWLEVQRKLYRDTNGKCGLRVLDNPTEFLGEWLIIAHAKRNTKS